MAAGPIPQTARMGVWQQDLASDQAATDWYCPERGDFTLTLTGTWTGSATVQRSFDGGTTPIAYTFADQAFAPTANFSSDFAQVEKNVLWRVLFNKTTGTMTARLGQ